MLVTKFPTQETINRFTAFTVKEGDMLPINEDYDQVPVPDATDAQLGKYLIDAQVLKKKLDEFSKAISLNIDTVSARLGERMLENEQAMCEYTTEMGNTRKLRLKTEVNVSIKTGHIAEAIKWFISQGLSAIVKPTVHPATLKATIEHYLQQKGQAVNFLTEDNGEEEESFDNTIDVWQNIESLKKEIDSIPDQALVSTTGSVLPDCISRKLTPKAYVTGS